MVSLQEHTVLVLPFTWDLLADPTPLLPTIRSTLISSATTSFTVIFTTPIAPTLSSSSDAISVPARQLYSTLRASPPAYFGIFQSFLGKIYASLAAAQWASDRILLDVEVHVNGEDGDWAEKIHRYPGTDDKTQVILVDVDGLLDSLSSEINNSLSPTRHTIPVSLPSPSSADSASHPSTPKPGYEVVALGGTFDHLHAAHKLLLHLAYFLATRKVIVGIMADSLLGTKSNRELVQRLDVRLRSVREFMRRLGGKLPTARDNNYDGVEIAAEEIQDTLGPTAYESNIQALVVSRETTSGGTYVNEMRKKKGLNDLDLYIVDVITAEAEREREIEGIEDESRLKVLKMGSTGIRKWIADREKEKA